MKYIDKNGLKFQIHVKEEAKYEGYKFMEIKSIILYLQNGNIEITDLSKEIKDNKNIYSFFF